jgi:YggT family protein
MLAIFWLIDTVIGIYIFMLIASAIRRIIPNLGGIDISPIILILILQFANMLIQTDVRAALLGY